MSDVGKYRKIYVRLWCHPGFTGLSDGLHTIKILVLGSHRTGASGSFVAVDRWLVS